MIIQLNLSPYIINFLNSFADANASQATEQIIRQYMDALKRQQVVVEPQTYLPDDRVERQRVSMTPTQKPKLERKQMKGNVVKKSKKIKPTR